MYPSNDVDDSDEHKRHGNVDADINEASTTKHAVTLPTAAERSVDSTPAPPHARPRSFGAGEEPILRLAEVSHRGACRGHGGSCARMPRDSHGARRGTRDGERGIECWGRDAGRRRPWGRGRGAGRRGGEELVRGWWGQQDLVREVVLVLKVKSQLG